MVKITLHKGDITKLKVDAIVNPSNPSGLGCFTPNHPCLDHQIHAAAGPTLLEECRSLGGVPTGTAKITHGHNLPAKYIIHSTGPKRDGDKQDFRTLSHCYYNILNLADEYNIKTLAFCSISTGMYGFDKDSSAQVAVSTVKKWLTEHKTKLTEIIFAVYSAEEMDIYRQLLANK
jgi:O-acetyl-ADP-ribose deacetylase